MTYFHTGIRTIIGVLLFHGPVRDGKGWGQKAMVVRLETGDKREGAGKGVIALGHKVIGSSLTSN